MEISMNMQFWFEYAASVKSSIKEAIVGSVFKFVNLSDGFSIHQNATIKIFLKAIGLSFHIMN